MTPQTLYTREHLSFILYFPLFPENRVLFQEKVVNLKNY